MDYYLNQLTNQFTRSIGFPGSVTTATFKARDTITLDVYFHNGSNLLALAEGASLVFIIKASFEQNAVALALADEWDEIASGHYRSQLNLNTEALITAMGDLDLLNLFAELTWSETPGHWESSPTLRVRLNNDLYKGIEGTPLALPTPLSWLTANLTQSKIQTSITNDHTFRAAIGAAASDDVPPVLTVLLGESWSNGTVLRLDVSGFGAYFALGETYDASPVFRPLVNDGVGTLPRVRYEPSGSEGEGWYFDYDAGTAFFLASDNSAYPPTEQLWEDRIGSDTISVLTTIEFDANPSASKVGQHLHIALADGGVEMREALRINPTIWSEPMTRGVSQNIDVDDPNASFEPITSADDATIITPRRFWIYLSYWLTRTADKTISGAVSFLNSITVSGSATVGSLIAATSARVTGAPATPATSDSLLTAAQADARYGIALRFTYTTAPSGWTGGSGVWTGTLPAWCNSGRISCVDAGGGGGSGRRGATGTACFGGGGGACGSRGLLNFISSLLPSTTLIVTVGLGGAGGASVTTDDTNGNSGAAGGLSRVQSAGATIIAGCWDRAGSAVASTAATPAATAASGTGGALSGNAIASTTTILGRAGKNSSITAAAGPNSVNLGESPLDGGPAGGGISAANVAYAGGTNFAAGQGTTNGSDAQLSAASTAPPKLTVPGLGGSGSGATRNGFASGKGGDGADGQVIIFCY